MSDYQGKRFKASQIPDPSKPGAARAAQQGRTSSPQQPRAPRSVTPTSHRRQDTPAAYRPSSYSTAKKPPRSSSHAAPSDYTEPPRKKRRSIIPILLIIIGIGLIVAAAAIFINAQIGYKQASESYQKIEEQYAPAKDASGVPVIDFNALAQTNPEVVGWIYAPGTNINYPVVQATDNSKVPQHVVRWHVQRIGCYLLGLRGQCARHGGSADYDLWSPHERRIDVQCDLGHDRSGDVRQHRVRVLHHARRHL